MYIKYGHICKGCTFEVGGKYCKIYEVGKSKKCPCITCLVKVMCDKACRPYFNLRRNADKQLYGP